MYPDPHSNPLLPFKATKEIPILWHTFLVPDSMCTLYSAPGCDILIQEIHLGNRHLWYLIFEVTKNDLLIRLVLPPALVLLLLYNVRNNGEMIFVHNDMGIGINEKDYCYLGNGFSNKDLRVLVSTGTYRTVAFPFFHDNINITHTGIGNDATMAFIETYLFAAGISTLDLNGLSH